MGAGEMWGYRIANSSTPTKGEDYYNKGITSDMKVVEEIKEGKKSYELHSNKMKHKQDYTRG